jgi:hypothetical protein
MQKLALRACLFIPLGIFIAGVNVIVDPAGILSCGSYEREVAALLVAGSNVGGLGDFDDRLLQQYYIETLHDRLDIAVIGSSRSMYVRSKLFRDCRFFNNSLSMATLEDLILIHRIYQARGFVPKTIILGIDDWMMAGQEEGGDLWLTYDTKYLQGMDNPSCLRVRRGAFQCRRFGQLISPSYFHVAAWNLMKGTRGKPYPVVAQSSDSGLVKLADGSISYRQQIRARTQDEVDLLAKRVPIRREATLDLETSRRGRRFESFVALARASGSKVVVFLAPYHPRAFGRIRPGVEPVEAYVRGVASRFRLVVVGSFDPSVAGCDAAEFFDEGHPRESCIERMFQKDWGSLGRGGDTPSARQSPLPSREEGVVELGK